MTHKTEHPNQAQRINLLQAHMAPVARRLSTTRAELFPIGFQQVLVGPIGAQLSTKSSIILAYTSPTWWPAYWHLHPSAVDENATSSLRTSAPCSTYTEIPSFCKPAQCASIEQIRQMIKRPLHSFPFNAYIVSCPPNCPPYHSWTNEINLLGLQMIDIQNSWKSWVSHTPKM